jgi:hypothetical protein
VFSQESQAWLIRERLDSHCRAGEALHLIAGLTLIVGMMEHTGGRIERERCRAGGAFWQFATRAPSGAHPSR